MRALVFERSIPKYAAATIAGRLMPGQGAKVGPLVLKDIDPPDLPASTGWHRVRPRLAGICGSDLATIDGHSSRYFEPIVSFPFVPGHEVVGEVDDGRRVVLMATLTCAARGFDEQCRWCADGQTHRCERTAFGHLPAGLQTGFCEATSGGWSTGLVAHESQLFDVPGDLSDEAAVLIEPVACAVHAVRSAGALDGGGTVAVIGAGTLGLTTLAALRHMSPDRPGEVIATAKHPAQRALAKEFDARVADPGELERAVRRATGSLVEGAHLSAGAHVVFDCVGSADSIAQALRVADRGGHVVLVGMPGNVDVDLTPLWHREIALRGSYAYTRADFETAVEVIRAAGLGRLVSALYSLDRYREAIDHAANAGRRGAVKIAFDLRQERR